MKIKNHNRHNCNRSLKDVTKVNNQPAKKQRNPITDKQNIPPNQSKKKDKLGKNHITDRIHSASTISPENDPITVYENQIIHYLKSRSSETCIDVAELKKNGSMGKKIRAFVIKFFFKIKFNFKLKRKTIHLATYYLDAFLQNNCFGDKKQLVIYAQAALWMAMKYQEIYPPESYEWISKSRIKDVLNAESEILYALDFKILIETKENFLEFYMAKIELDRSSEKMIKILIDLTLFDEAMYKYNSQELTKQIILSITNPKKIDERSDMVIKWMIQRNQSSLSWLHQNEDQVIMR